jgi:acyl-coenzyme A thioesterase PaaI-like protein
MNHRVTGKQQNSKMCFLCGLKNSFGLKGEFFELENNELVCIFKPSNEHQSYPGRLHGGITTAVLDETIGRAIMMNSKEEVWGVTIEFTTRFKKQIPLNEELRVVGRITNQTSRTFEGTGELLCRMARLPQPVLENIYACHSVKFRTSIRSNRSGKWYGRNKIRKLSISKSMDIYFPFSRSF